MEIVTIEGKDFIEACAKRLAETQRKADVLFYEKENQKMSSYLIDTLNGMLDMCAALGVKNRVYEEAYKIYDFRNSGKKGYTLRDGKIVPEHPELTFAEAFQALKAGKRVKRVGWSGWWEMVPDKYSREGKQTIYMHCADGRVLDIRDTKDVLFTVGDMAENDWVVLE